MSSLAERSRPRSRAGAGAVIWFSWMVVMWLAFFALVFAGQIGSVWSAVTALPVLVQLAAWIAFLPWMLATWVWTGTWVEWIRLVAVAAFAIGWTLVSIPKAWRESR